MGAHVERKTIKDGLRAPALHKRVIIMEDIIETENIEIYDVPGLNTYVVAEPRMEPPGVFSKGPTYKDVLHNLNDALEQDGASYTLYTESGSTYDVNELRTLSKNTQDSAVAKIKSDAFGAAIWGYFLYPYGLVVSAMNAVDAFKSYGLMKEGQRLEKNIVKGHAEKSEGLSELHDLYNDLDIPSIDAEIHREIGQLSFFRKIVPPKDVRERIMDKMAEKSLAYQTLNLRARELAEEMDDENFLYVAQAYEKAAHGHHFPMIGVQKEPEQEEQ